MFTVGLGLNAVSGGAALPFIAKFGISVAVGTTLGTGISMLQGNSFGDALLDGFSDSVLWSGAFSFASGAVRASKYGYAYATKNTEMMAKLFTHNPNATAAMLGHFDDGAATGYVVKAKAGRHTYFSMSKRRWKRLVARFSEEGMWDINQAFLSQQISLGKVFLFSHQNARWGTIYQRELIYLLLYGII